MKITEYDIKTAKQIKSITIACVSDLHARKFKRVIDSLKCIEPNIILLAGDILEVSNEYMQKRNECALEFLRQAAQIATTYYCFGNHEIYNSHASDRSRRVSDQKLLNENIKKIRSFGIHLVNDSFEKAEMPNSSDIYIGGLVCGEDTDPELNKKEPDLSFLQKFDKISSYKILMCHYPHYYGQYLKNTDFDLIFAGHAHGGQWRIFGHGIYSPHQGLFPKLTSGLHYGKLIISRGVTNNSRPIPRLFNQTEVLKVTISQY